MAGVLVRLLMWTEEAAGRTAAGGRRSEASAMLRLYLTLSADSESRSSPPRIETYSSNRSRTQALASRAPSAKEAVDSSPRPVIPPTRFWDSWVPKTRYRAQHALCTTSGDGWRAKARSGSSGFGSAGDAVSCCSSFWIWAAMVVDESGCCSGLNISTSEIWTLSHGGKVMWRCIRIYISNTCLPGK